MDEKMCRVIVGNTGKLEFIAPQTVGHDIKRIIEEDKLYGKMRPANGKYFTVRVLDGDKELSKKETQKIIKYAHRRIELRLPIKFKIAKIGQYADFRLDFETVESDPRKELQENTIMYHYFPINSFDNPNRGLCVINKKFFFTGHGDSILGQTMIEKGTPVQYAQGKYTTIDFDQVYTHELGHGLGLPHSKLTGNVMSSRYDLMAEFLTQEDILRLQAKYGKRIISFRHLARWLRWLFVASDR